MIKIKSQFAKSLLKVIDLTQKLLKIVENLLKVCQKLVEIGQRWSEMDPMSVQSPKNRGKLSKSVQNG
jgi:hypothetical protein